jgi:hypothetical protein
MSISVNLSEIEKLISELGSEPKLDNAYHDVRKIVCAAIRDACPVGHYEGASLADHIEIAAKDAKGRRIAALLILRCLGAVGIIPDNDDGSQIQRKIVFLVEQGAPDISQFFKLPEKKQTIDKFDILCTVHAFCSDFLRPIRMAPTSTEDFPGWRQEIFKILNSKILKSYFNNYEFGELSAHIKSVCNSICELQNLRDATFGQKFQDILELLEQELIACKDKCDFFVHETYLPFLRNAQAILTKIDKDSTGRLECEIGPKRPGPYYVERRYRLHQADRDVRLKIPLVNYGPGFAIDTTAQVICMSNAVALNNQVINIGGVPPGEFALAFEMLVVEPVQEVILMIHLTWRTVRGIDRRETSFEAVIQSQNPNVDWEILDSTDPYSTEIATGDEFVGRREKVLTLGNRFLKERMQSSYITGQKRVGKTSLAYAVKDFVRKSIKNRQIEVIYLEYGDYARKDADGTVEALGKAIAQRLLAELAPELRPPDLDFRGSLAPLNQVSQILSEAVRNKVYLIILDEFDEIHPEMYRYGPLAEAFFSNLRTLSAKRNMAFMLVGGENMPFIIGAQGDQLNKFVREPLDYFSRSAEWENFVQLVRQKSVEPLNWHDPALTELFNYTNGHPYYTKLVCARIFQNAVADRDTEITVEEIQRAVTSLIDILDINAFAHFWKDGIPSSRQEAEVIELKRCRVLVAIARTLRQRQPLTAERIIENKHSAEIAGTEVPPILSDFCRREILREKGGQLEFVLPLFEQWLVHKGMTTLITDTFGDEMADALRQANDQAYVQAPEIAAVIERWPAYRGKRIAIDDVRAWLGQRDDFREQRYLFKLLQNVRFITEDEIREKLRTAHSIVKRYASPFTPKNRAERRNDIIITYVDGATKSGNVYAGRYADENLISVSCILDATNFARKVADYEEKREVTVNGVVIIDDIAATGRTLSEKAAVFFDENKQFLRDRNITIVVVVLTATREADARIRGAFGKIEGVQVDLRICELIDARRYAFGDDNGIWQSGDEKEQARALVTELGRGIYRDQPLGFGNLGLLIVFPETCPNNVLPILHASGSSGWRPLFPRPRN